MSEMPKYATTYVTYYRDVFGPGRGVLKVGRAWRQHRIWLQVRYGAHLILDVRGTDATWEREALRELAVWFPKAFRHENDAYGILPLGRGWTECFIVDEYDLNFAVDRIIDGFAKGNDRRVTASETESNIGAGSRVTRVPEDPARGETDSDRPVGTHRPVGETSDDSGTDRGGCVPGRSSDGSDTRAPADPGRVRVPQPVPGRRRRVATTHQAAQDRPAGRGNGLPGPTTTRSRSFTKVHGCGESGRASARADAGRAPSAGCAVGARARARASGDARTSVVAECPADWVSRASERARQGLWALQGRSPQPGFVDRRAGVRTQTDRLLRAGGGVVCR